MKKLTVTIGIILALIFFVSLIAALSSEEVELKKHDVAPEKEYNCSDKHTVVHVYKCQKSCGTPEKYKAMKCDTTMCKSIHEKCAMAGKKCNPSDCPYHSGKCLKEKKNPEEACTKHADKNVAADKKCDPITCAGKCPAETQAEK